MIRFKALMILIALVTSLNTYLFLTRHTRTQGVVSDYSSLYNVTDRAYIKELHRSNESLYLSIEGLAQETSSGQLRIDESPPLDINPAISWAIPLLNGQHHYRLALSANRQIDFDVNLVPPAHNPQLGRSRKGSLTITGASIPLLQDVRYSLADWTAGYNSKETTARIQEAMDLLSLDAQLMDEYSSREKVRALTVYLLDQLSGNFGITTDRTESLSGLVAFEEARNMDILLTCSTLARIYCAFANLAGLPSREVFALGVHNDITFTGHAFAETWIAEEGRWAFVDLSSHKALITNAQNEVLNAAQVLHAVNIGSGTGLLVHKYHDGKVTELPLAEHMASELYYFGPNTNLVFLRPRPRPMSLSEKAVAYLFRPKLIYSLNPAPIQARMLLVRSSQCLLLILIILTLFSFLYSTLRPQLIRRV